MNAMIPTPDNRVSLRALQRMRQEGHVLAALEVFSEALGPIFRFSLPGFRPVMLVGPEAARFVLVSAREDLRWRTESDPVTLLLRHGVLVEDGSSHDLLRRTMNPSLHKSMLRTYVATMSQDIDRVMAGWVDGHAYDMLVEMRRAALLILSSTLFRVDFYPDMAQLWTAVLKTIQYISPGFWMIWRGIPRPGYNPALRQMDAYLYRIIGLRRAESGDTRDLLGLLIAADLDDGLIRDQLLTMLIAGHDTSTALLSWTLYLLGKHPEALRRVRDEVDSAAGDEDLSIETLTDMPYLDQVLDEALRLYPPIHLGSRTAAADLNFNGYTIPAGTRVLYSIYLTHRLKTYWPEPCRFDPERFAPGTRHEPYTFLPFGGGPRNCIGAMFGQVEAKVVLARLLRHYDLELLPKPVHPHMGATLEPRPGVWMRVRRR
jgi:cytochrome P450